MKHWIALTLIILAGGGAIVMSERRKVDVPPGPSAMLYLVADTEKELTRMPVRFTRMSDAEEIEAGDVIATSYGTQREEEKDASTRTVEKYLAQVGARLAAHATRKLPYKFHYVPDKYFINAFAVPGGHVYVGRGLLALMDSEDELASVMGHEIEHIDHYHCAERVQLEQALRKIPLGGLASIPIEIFQAGYSKDQELEADREGTSLAVMAGYSPNGAIRMFERFQRIEETARVKARNPGEEITEVVNQTLEGYFRSHPLPSERIAVVQNLIAGAKWPARPERDLAIGYIFWSARAEDLFKQHRYAEAQATALRSLKMNSDQQEALDTLARSYFSQANFEDAVTTYRRILQLNGSRLEVVKYYAIALAAADKRTAAAEFDRWSKTAAVDLRNIPATLPGLYLLAGERAPASNLADAMDRNKDGTPPDQFGDLGWWYYLAGDYQQALKLLEEAVQRHPGEVERLTDRAWVQIQNKTLLDALQNLDAAYSSGKDGPDRKMARAVAFWLSDQKDAGLREFAQATAEQPEWTNPRWVRALYSPLVGDAVQQMQAEQERLKKLQQARLQK